MSRGEISETRKTAHFLTRLFSLLVPNSGTHGSHPLDVEILTWPHPKKGPNPFTYIERVSTSPKPLAQRENQMYTPVAHRGTPHFLLATGGRWNYLKYKGLRHIALLVDVVQFLLHELALRPAHVYMGRWGASV